MQKTWDMGSIPGFGRSPEEGTATHSSILAWRISMGREVWRATVHEVTKRWTWLKQLNTHSHLFNDSVRSHRVMAQTHKTTPPSDDEVNRMRSERVLSIGPSVPVDLGCITFPMCLFANQEALQTPDYWYFMEVSSPKHGHLLTPLFAPVPSLEDGVGIENLKLLITIWSFWWLVPSQSHPGAHPESPYQNKRCF